MNRVRVIALATSTGAGAGFGPAAAAAAAREPAPIAAAPGIELLDYGLWRPGSLPPVPVPEPGTLAGIGDLYDWGEFYQRTTTVCARLGMHFGFSYRLARTVPDPSWALRLVVDHGRMTRPDGRSATRETVFTSVGHSPSREVWGFDLPYELVAGPWTMALWHDATLLARVTFDVRGDCAAATS